MAVVLEYLKRKVIEWRFTNANFVLNITLLLHFTNEDDSSHEIVSGHTLQQEELEMRLTLMKVLYCNKTNTDGVKKAHDGIVDVINSLGMVSQLESEVSSTSLTYECIEGSGTLTESMQPFGTYIWLKLDKIQVSNLGESSNAFYQPQWFDVVLNKWLPMAPFWTSLLLGDMQHHKDENVHLQSAATVKSASNKPSRAVKEKWSKRNNDHVQQSRLCGLFQQKPVAPLNHMSLSVHKVEVSQAEDLRVDDVNLDTNSDALLDECTADLTTPNSTNSNLRYPGLPEHLEAELKLKVPMPSSTFQLEKQDLMNVASGGWIDSKIIASYFELMQRSNMQKHGIMTKWFDPTFIPLLKAKGYSAVKRYCKGKDLLKNEVLLFPVHKVVHIQRHVIKCIDSLHQKVKLPQAERTICAKQNQESNAESLGCDIDAADDEDDSYAEAENDTDCNSGTDGDLNAGVPQDFLVPDFRNAPDPDDIFALRWGKSFYMKNFPHFKTKTLDKHYPFPRHIIRRVVKDLEPTLRAILTKDTVSDLQIYFNEIKQLHKEDLYWPFLECSDMVLEVFYYLQELDCDVKKQAALSLSLVNKCVVWPEIVVALLMDTFNLERKKAIKHFLNHTLPSFPVYNNHLKCARTIPHSSELFIPLENAIRTIFLPSLTGQSPFNDTDRNMLALPTRLGGLGIINPSLMSLYHYTTSVNVTSALANLVITRATLMPSDLGIQQLEEKNLARNQRKAMETASVTELLAILPAKQKRSVEIASEKGASSWLNALPIARHGFALHKSAFRDAICLRYGWQPPLLPSHYICGSIYTVEHAMNCPSGSFPSIRHNEVRDLTSAFLSEVCHNVHTEPTLQPLQGEHLKYKSANGEVGARLDVAAQNFWGKDHQTAYFDVRIFNPFAQIRPCQNAIENMNWIRRGNMKKVSKRD
ncbi:hypothetical protein EMCRGX_G015533 [Ephydatia muelleri]